LNLKILILTPRIPYPLRDGGSIAMNQTIEEYINIGCEVSVLAMNTSRHWVDEQQLPEYYKQLKILKTVYVKTNVNPLSAFFNLFTDKSYNVTRFINKEYEKLLIEIISSHTYDFIQFESIYVAPYLDVVRAYSKAHLFCRIHNIEHLIWQRLTDHENSFLKKKYLQLLTTRLKNYELNIIRQFDLLLSISAKEAVYFKENNLNKCYHLPFGVHTTERNSNTKFIKEMKSCYHIGSMDWAPNAEGVHWLLEKIWPLVLKKSSDVKLYLAGKNMPANLVSKPDENIFIVGEINDVAQFSLEKNIMLVPLLAGAGIRIKILEAMALGKAIISTSIGFEGIPIQHGFDGIIADTEDEFANAIEYCITNPGQAEQIGIEAQKSVHKHFDLNMIYKNWLSFYNELI
jgi:polysaccharide biosynthesis protein PslH